MVAAGGSDYGWETTAECFTTSTPAVSVWSEKGTTYSTTYWIPYTETSTYSFTVTSTEIVPTTIPTTETDTETSTFINTDYIYVTETETETDTFTSLTTLPAVTVFITTTLIETDTLLPSTVTTTATSLDCEFCKIDIYATLLTFPTVYTTTTIASTTYDLYPTSSNNGTTYYSTKTVYAPICPSSCVASVVSTWVAFDVILTSPTTYLAYTNFSHAYLEPRPTLYGCGELVYEPLDLGPSSTDFVDLIWPTTAIPTSPTTAAPELISFLDTIPTVVAQLDGVPAISCDDPTLESVQSSESKDTVTITSTTSGAVTYTAKAL
jgi:hypothetical protein